MTRGARKDSFGAYLAPVVIKKCRVSPHSEKRHEAQPTRRTGDDAERDAHARCTPCFEAPDLITSSTRKRTGANGTPHELVVGCFMRGLRFYTRAVIGRFSHLMLHVTHPFRHARWRSNSQC